MFPFRDNIPSRTFPFITVLIIAANVGMFLYELWLGENIRPFIDQYAVVPAQAFTIPSFAGGYERVLIPYLTSLFLHGGWLHLIGNMWYLWIFGDNIEDRLGHGRYLLFYVLCGLAAGITHTLLNSSSTVPSLGASGAIAGVLGAYLISYPMARILTVVPLFIFIQIVEIPAVIVLLFWFLMQFLSGSAALGTADTGGVAWWAHVGGFLAGMILLALFKKEPRRAYEYSR